MKARVFTDIWETKEDLSLEHCKESDIVWPTGLEHSDFDFPLDPDAVRRQSRTFRITTSFGTDVVHPRQVALLSDSLLQFTIGIFIAMVKTGFSPPAVSLILIKLIPKSEEGERPVGLSTAFIRVLLTIEKQQAKPGW